ncbi:MAG: hypothetical protein WDW36_000051 [Sanguina aurantia]
MSERTHHHGEHSRRAQDSATGSLLHVQSTFKARVAAEHVVHAALRESIADAYASYIGQIHSVPTDVYGLALYALDRAYRPRDSATAGVDFNLASSPFSTSRAKHAAIHNAAHSILRKLGTYVRDVEPSLPADLDCISLRSKEVQASATATATATATQGGAGAETQTRPGAHDASRVGSTPIQSRHQPPHPPSTVPPQPSSSPSSRATAASAPPPTRVGPEHGSGQSTQPPSHAAQAGVSASRLAAGSRPGTAPQPHSHAAQAGPSASRLAAGSRPGTAPQPQPQASSRPLSRGAGVALLQQAGFAAASAHPRSSQAGSAAPGNRQPSPVRPSPHGAPHRNRNQHVAAGPGVAAAGKAAGIRRMERCLGICAACSSPSPPAAGMTHRQGQGRRDAPSPDGDAPGAHSNQAAMGTSHADADADADAGANAGVDSLVGEEQRAALWALLHALTPRQDDHRGYMRSHRVGACGSAPAARTEQRDHVPELLPGQQEPLRQLQESRGACSSYSRSRRLTPFG